MENQDQVSADTTSPAAPSQPNQTRLLSPSRLRHLARAAAACPHQAARLIGRALRDDWRTHKYVLCAALLVSIITTVVVTYYLNHPQLDSIDTREYLKVVRQIQVHGQLVDVKRLPGYPLLIVLVYTFIGQGNLLAVSVVQTVLFVLAILELYVLACLITRRVWIALLIGLLVGTNLILLSYVQPIMSEALAIWLVVSLALAVTLFVYTQQVRFFWFVTICILVLFLTRPEWMFLPLPLFAYLLSLAARQRVARRLLPHMLVSTILIYAILGNYIYINAMANGFTGVTEVQGVNALGKVLQYDMQNEARPQDAAIGRTMNSYVSHGIKDPYLIWLHDRALMSRGETYSYAYAIIERHPAEFLIKSVPLALSSLSSLTDAPIVNHNGFLEGPLDELQSISSYLYKWSKFFPICVFIWIGLQVWKRTASLHFVQAMGGIVLLTLYGLIVTTLGGYGYYDRLHTPFLPLLILVVWCTLLNGALLLAQEGPSLLACLTSHYFRRQQVSIPTATILIASLGGVGLLLFMARLLLTHGTSSQVGVVFFFVLSVVSIFRYFRRSTQE